MNQYDGMEIDIRKHPQVRADVRAGLLALKVQGRQIRGLPEGEASKHTLPEIVIRLMKGVGDLAGLVRDTPPRVWQPNLNPIDVDSVKAKNELKKELGNVVFSTVRWIDDLGLDVLECLDLAIEAQEKFANSGRPR